MKSDKSIAIILSILSAMFFSATFVGNRLISVEGGHWIWSTSLRFFWMIPILLILVGFRNNIRPVFEEIKKKPLQWIIWSSVGFGICNALLTFSVAYAPSWLVAGTWQVTIIAGMLMSPFINKTSYKETFSAKTLFFSLIILIGVCFMQINQAKNISISEILIYIVPILLSAFSYPLGNRMMMKVTDGKLNSVQRTLGMTIASLPFLILLSIYGASVGELPTENQIYQTLLVAICAGIIATVLFFMATDRVRKDEKALASVEAVQSSEVMFALIGEIVILGIALPDNYSIFGMGLIILGMALHSLKK